MAFWDRLFGKGKKDNSDKQGEPTSDEQLKWIEADQNPWNVELLDLRPLTQTVLSTSEDAEMASNAISYGKEDGLVFLDQKLASTKSIDTRIIFTIDSKVERGVLYIPSEMENKWAIYFHENKILFIRSWLRKVLVIAETISKNDQLIVHNIRGEFTENESAAFTEAVLKFLMHSHVLEEIVPAPLPKELQSDTKLAALWAFSVYGNMAHFGCFDLPVVYTSEAKIRSHSLLHIAIAKGELDKIKEELDHGANINALAGDGLSTLQWAITTRPEILEFLLKEGADPNRISEEGASPIMNAVQANEMEHLKLLVNYNGDVNKQDHRGFTALHRAAEMGHVEMVKELLNQGANKEIEVEGHTAFSLAKARENKEIIELLA